MPFVVEEEKSGINWFLILGVLLGIGFAGLMAYYLFFASTPFIETLIPARSEIIVEIAKSKIDPNEVVNNPAFQSLRQYTLPLEVGEVGRTNPFLPF